MRSKTTETSEGPRFLTEAGQPRAFVIVSSARSGSNLLVGYLRQVERAACFGEIMRSEFPAKRGWGKLNDRLEMPSESLPLHSQDLTAWWETVLAQGLRRRRWLGAKAFYYHRRGDPIWDRFDEVDHRLFHLWRDATFDQYVSRLLAMDSGQWKAADSTAAGVAEPQVEFDRAAYLEYRAQLRDDIVATRARYGASERYVELEYRQLADRAQMAELLQRLFGEPVEVRETLKRQRGRPKIEYLRNPDDAAPFVADSISGGFADQ